MMHHPSIHVTDTLLNKPRTKQSLLCKICLEKDDLSELISPCRCSGSIKYVHPRCMTSWRRSLLECGRERDLYRCTLCQQELFIKQRNMLRALLDYKATRAIGTFLILLLLLVPIGSVMKMIIHFSALVTNDPNGGWSQAWSEGTLLQLIYTSMRTAFMFMLTNTTPSPLHVNYSPFPICTATNSHTSMFLNGESMLTTTTTTNINTLFAESHSLLSHPILYTLLFPFSDERLWRFLLCRLEHIHLGFFLFGSVANIWYTCQILNDMFDIVFMSDDQDHDRIQQPDTHTQEEEDQQQHQRTGIMAILTRQGGKLAKRLLVAYSCALVVLFWVHFNLLAFVVSETSNHVTTAKNTFTESSTSSSSWVIQQQQQQMLLLQRQSSNQFIAELPLWALRWATLGVAVGSVMSKMIYPWLSRCTSCIDHEIVLSLPPTIDESLSD